MLGALILLSGCGEDEAIHDTSGATEYAPMISSSVPVQESVLRDRVLGSGVIEGQQEAVIRASAGGTIRSISFELGERFDEGDELMMLDDTVQQLTVSQIARQYGVLEADVASKEELYSRGALSESRLTQARAELEGVEAQLEQAKDAVEAARITAPISGSIAEKSPNLVRGDTLQAGTQIARMINLEQLRVSLSVGQAQIFFIKPGYRAEIRIPTPSGDIVADGAVTAVSAGSDRRTGSWKVLVDFPNPAPETLRAGLTANVAIFHDDAPLQQVVPAGALVRRDGKTGVFIIEEGRARLVEVEVLDQRGDLAAVSSVEDDIDLQDKSVLTSGLTRLRSGDAAATGPDRE